MSEVVRDETMLIQNPKNLRKWFVLGLLFVIFWVLVPLTFTIISWGLSAGGGEQVQPGTPQVTLELGDGYYYPPDGARKIVLTVPPTGRNGSTKWVARSLDHKRFWVDPESGIELRKAYADGNFSEWVLDTPIKSVVDGRVKGFQFRNPTNNPVRVTLYLQN